MSNKEKIIQGILTEEEADDAFCEKMIQDYLNDPTSEKEEVYPLEDCKKEWGIA